jgi:hypothetical protein
MKGNWKGKYWFSGTVPDSLKNRKTNFELIIDNYSDNKISGKITDDIETGGTKGIGSFLGSVRGNKIKFVKRMPISTSVLQDGTIIEENKSHRPIYYKGTIEIETDLIQGTWKCKMGIGFLQGRLAFYSGISGEWEMKRASDN